MKNQEKISIEKLAELLKETVWSKGDLKRIYIDRGFNTKKMSTKTYIYEVDGQFKVSCFVDCPSQPYQWCKSQGQEVIDSVESEIETSIIRSENPEKWENMPYSHRININRFLSKSELIQRGQAISFSEQTYETIKSEISDIINEVTMTIHGDKSGEFRLRKPNDKSIEEVLIERKAILFSNEKVKSTDIFELSEKVRHDKFGTGVISAIEKVAENFVLIINFEGFGEKRLLQKFATLEKI